MTDLFQSEEYYSFLQRIGLFTPFRYEVSHNGVCKGILQGYIQKDGGYLKRFFSRRAVVNGGPYWTEDTSEEEKKQLLTNVVRELRNKVIFIESRNFRDYSEDRNIFEKIGFVYEPHYDFIVDTSSEDVVDTNMGKVGRGM